jgi:hypothetical protein
MGSVPGAINREASDRGPREAETQFCVGDYDMGDRIGEYSQQIFLYAGEDHRQ